MSDEEPGYQELDNIRIVHDDEERLRSEILALIEQIDDRKSQLVMIEWSLHLTAAFAHQYEAKNADEHTVQLLGVRLFNAGASAVKLGLSGYYQPALSLTRDIMETGFLIDHLRASPDDIARWRNLPDKEHQKAFGPEPTRKLLEARDGVGVGERAEVYRTLSKMASHPTVRGFALTRKDGQGHLGPFVDEGLIDGFLREMVMRLAPAAWVFSLYFDEAPPEVITFREFFGVKLVELIRGWGVAAASD